MFSALTDKVKGVFWVTTANAEHIASDNVAPDHDKDCATTISATSSAWTIAMDVKDLIEQSAGSHFGGTVYCVKRTEGKDATNTWNDIKTETDAAIKTSKNFPLDDFDIERFVGFGFEAATDEFVSVASVKECISKTLNSVSLHDEIPKEIHTNDDLVSSSANDTKSVTKGPFRKKEILADTVNVSAFGKIRNVRHSLVPRYRD